MILDVGQTCDLKPTHRNHIQNRIKTISKSYQNRVKIVLKSYQTHKNLRKIDQKPVPGLFLCLFLKPTHWKHIKTVSTSYQNRIKNHIKTTKPSRNRPKGCPRAVSVSFLEANPSGTLKKALRSQTISKP
jgi:hypothetical protein